MTNVDKDLLARNRGLERKMSDVAARYKAMRDARWMFARAHGNITHQINFILQENPAVFRDPNQLLRFNIFFATVFLAAAAENGTAPWRTAFAACRPRQDLEELGVRRGLPRPSAGRREGLHGRRRPGGEEDAGHSPQPPLMKAATGA
jgi:hypothetical protein